MVIPCPIMMEKYFSANAKIDQHNRIRQDDLKLERKIRTVDWSQRVNLSILGVIIVDSYLVWRDATDNGFVSKDDYFMELATQLIDNSYDEPRRRPRVSDPESPASAANTRRARTGQGIYLTPAKRKRRTKDGKNTAHRAQGRCRACGTKSTVVCSACLEQGVPENQAHYCPPGNKHKVCFTNHMNMEHLGEGLDRTI